MQTISIIPIEVQPRLKTYTAKRILKSGYLDTWSNEKKLEFLTVSSILPFKVNEYVLNYLIDWEREEKCPMYQLLFPQKAMLEKDHYDKVKSLISLTKKPNILEIESLAKEIRKQLNPHPADQQSLNLPILDGKKITGLQHKYQNTLLFFPTQGQTCHSYCSFCFRWAQFVGKDYRFALNDREVLRSYLEKNLQVTDLLMTGGDPMTMQAKKLADYLEIFLEKGTLQHVKNIRIGTKSLSFWPQRFLTDPDSEDLLNLLGKLIESGRHVSIMAHINHWREMDTSYFKLAVQKLQERGVLIRSQSPLLANINDDPNVWEKMWLQQVQMGIVPYYMFVERDTGSRRYFEISLCKAWQIYKAASSKLTGLARTARGPSMSCSPGKVEIVGVEQVKGEKVFVLRFIQARNPDWCYRPFFAQYDQDACWFDDLKPAFDEPSFFFEDEFKAMQSKD